MAETVGSLCDKLSIGALKIYHVQEQAQRRDIPAELHRECDERLAVLRRQRDDLAAELTQLVQDIASGVVVPRLIRQFKTYNDPRYRSSADDHAAGVTETAPTTAAPGP